MPSRIRHFAEILNPLFDPTIFMRTDRLFEFVCTLVRASGIHFGEWDPLLESVATLDDLRRLRGLDLANQGFPNPERTRLRLALLSYCHMTEMDFPYSLVANLLRLRLGRKYHVNPFGHLAVARRRKRQAPRLDLRPPSPAQKINLLRQLSTEAGFPAVGEAFDSIHDPAIRNAIYHSDYALGGGEFRLLNSMRKSRKSAQFSSVVESEELNGLLDDAFSFYTALFALHDRCLKSFGDFRDAFIPYDLPLKGLLQLVFEAEKRLIGFRVYWPNETLSEYSRTNTACDGLNLEFDADGSINFFVGIYASKPGKFSPLVEADAQPIYPVIPGTAIRPHWPEPMKVYKLDLNSSNTCAQSG
jgi:hypothetical protein